MGDNIILIGFMGSGKTSVGKNLARKTGRLFLDTDLLIQEEYGMTISEIFAQKGEGAFRKMETELLVRLADSLDHAVLSVGGGLPTIEENIPLLKALGKCVFLDVHFERIWTRIKNDNRRPLVRSGGRNGIRHMYWTRRTGYMAAADLVISINRQTVGQVALQIIQQLGESSEETGE